MSGRDNDGVGPIEVGGGTPGSDAHPPDISATGPSAVDLARYAAALAAADDLELVFDPLTDAFGDLYELVCAGDRLAASGAALTIQNLCLQACVVPAASAEAADDKIRVLAIAIRWAWSRVPALAAVLEATIAQDRERWGGDVSGRA